MPKCKQKHPMTWDNLGFWGISTCKIFIQIHTVNRMIITLNIIIFQKVEKISRVCSFNIYLFCDYPVHFVYKGCSHNCYKSGSRETFDHGAADDNLPFMLFVVLISIDQLDWNVVFTLTATVTVEIT